MAPHSPQACRLRTDRRPSSAYDGRTAASWEPGEVIGPVTSWERLAEHRAEPSPHAWWCPPPACVRTAGTHDCSNGTVGPCYCSLDPATVRLPSRRADCGAAKTSSTSSDRLRRTSSSLRPPPDLESGKSPVLPLPVVRTTAPVSGPIPTMREMYTRTLPAPHCIPATPLIVSNSRQFVVACRYSPQYSFFRVKPIVTISRVRRFLPTFSRIAGASSPCTAPSAHFSRSDTR